MNTSASATMWLCVAYLRGMWRYIWMALLVGVPSLQASLDAATTNASAVEEVIAFLMEQRLPVFGPEVRLCLSGVGDHSLEVSRAFLGSTSTRKLPQALRVILLRGDDPDRSLVNTLSSEYPGQVSFGTSLAATGGGCSVIVVAIEDPRFNAVEIRAVAEEAGRVVVVHLMSHCNFARAYECRFFQSWWNDIAAISDTSCGQSYCAAWVVANTIEDQILGAVDCAIDSTAKGDASDASGSGTYGLPSGFSQWQQDWFVYQNFVRGTAKDTRSASGIAALGATSADLRDGNGVFVDVGAFHPTHLSNTAFFERCLGWRGICVEPNPSNSPLFKAYRPRCQLVQNCVWSRPKSVVMSFEKDPIEAYIRDDVEEATAEEGQGDRANSGGQNPLMQGAVPIRGDGSRPEFRAECRTLQDILLSAGLGKPATVDYLSVDAESAEAEIFRNFPFDEFDIAVISIEVQVRNYYEVDALLLTGGYAKIAVLGGDHVYAKMGRPPTLPADAVQWQETMLGDFFAHSAPKTAAMK
eukprot:TRINITY_DN61579_c0_g1_i1.p1 TRINITY_DN61579_c0_g1~~TRINITY_DN61579_c0_g1_i1.p1  ORF type:complete len:525 (+),score=84.18 TRINITY_DN61579_c0_g1_i1:173-1747(+)